MSDASYKLKHLPMLLERGLRRNILSDQHKHKLLQLSLQDHLPALDLDFQKLPVYKNMNVSTLFDRVIDVHDNPKDIGYTKRFDSSDFDVIIDEGHLTEVKKAWREKRKLTTYDIFSNLNYFSEYQNYFVPKNRLSDLCYMNTTSPLLLKFTSNSYTERLVNYTGTGSNNLNCNTIIVDVGKNSSVDITEVFDATNMYFANIYYIVRKYATLNITRDIRGHNGSFVLDSHIIQHPDSVVNLNVFGGRNKYTQQFFDIDSYKYCTTNVNGRFEQDKDNTNNFYINMNHVDEGSVSKIDVRNTVEDTSFSSFYGKILISKKSDDVNAEMYNKNLQLSKDATVITEPTLDINNKNVQCKHGCTVSDLSKDDLFYLQTRGLDEVSSRDLLIRGFLDV